MSMLEYLFILLTLTAMFLWVFADCLPGHDLRVRKRIARFDEDASAPRHWCKECGNHFHNQVGICPQRGSKNTSMHVEQNHNPLLHRPPNHALEIVYSKSGKPPPPRLDMRLISHEGSGKTLAECQCRDCRTWRVELYTEGHITREEVNIVGFVPPRFIPPQGITTQQASEALMDAFTPPWYSIRLTQNGTSERYSTATYPTWHEAADVATALTEAYTRCYEACEFRVFLRDKTKCIQSMEDSAPFALDPRL